MKISDLPPGLRELAEKRMSDPEYSGWNGADSVSSAFAWSKTPERWDFWDSINDGNFSVYYGGKVTNLKWK